MVVDGLLVLRLTGLDRELDGSAVLVLLPPALRGAAVDWMWAPGLGRSDGSVRDGVVTVPFGTVRGDLSVLLAHLDAPVQVRSDRPL